METEIQIPWYAQIPGWAFPALLIALAMLAMLLGNLKRKKKEQQTRKFAQDNGYQWRQVDKTLPDRWTLRPFGQGRRRIARNVVFGDHNGWSFLAFDYHFTTGSGRNSSRHHYSVYVLTLPGSLPKLQADVEGIFGGRVARAFGQGDLQLGDEELDRTWKIETEDEEFGHAVFHERMRQLLRQTGPWLWGIEGDAIVSAESQALSVEEIRPRLDLMSAVVGQIPGDVWRTYDITETPRS